MTRAGKRDREAPVSRTEIEDAAARGKALQ
jgi:hypothetical protein